MGKNLGITAPTLPAPKARTEVSATTMALFVEKKGAGAAPASKLRSASRGVRLNCYVPPEVMEALERVAYEEKRSLTDAVTEGLTFWLKKTRRDER